MLYGLSCGHKYCRTCWNQFLTGHIGNTENEIFTCPEVGCDQPVDDEDVIKLVMNSNVISMYQQRICSSVVKVLKMTIIFFYSSHIFSIYFYNDFPSIMIRFDGVPLRLVVNMLSRKYDLTQRSVSVHVNMNFVLIAVATGTYQSLVLN